MPDPHFGYLRERGFVTRPARMEDLAEAVPMFNLAEAELIPGVQILVDEYEQEWQFPGFEPERDTRLVISPQGDLVGCAEVWTLLDPPVHPWMWARVHPDWRGQGIGTAMLAWSLSRAREALTRLPQHARFAPRVGSVPSHQPSIHLFEDFGFRPVRYTWTMAIDVNPAMPSPRWPVGIRLRPFQFPDDLEAVYLAMVDAFRDHWGFIEVPFDQGFRQWRHAAVELRPMDPSLWFLAVDGDQIAGIALCRARSDEDPEMGWVNTLGVGRAWRQRGLGLALLQHAFLALEQTGARRVGLGVDAQSLTGATRLYTKAGMMPTRQGVLYELELRSGEELGNQG